MDMRVPANSIVPFDNNVGKSAHTIRSTSHCGSKHSLRDNTIYTITSTISSSKVGNCSFNKLYRFGICLYSFIQVFTLLVPEEEFIQQYSFSRAIVWRDRDGNINSEDQIASRGQPLPCNIHSHPLMTMTMKCGS